MVKRIIQAHGHLAECVMAAIGRFMVLNIDVRVRTPNGIVLSLKRGKIPAVSSQTFRPRGLGV